MVVEGDQCVARVADHIDGAALALHKGRDEGEGGVRLDHAGRSCGVQRDVDIGRGLPERVDFMEIRVVEFTLR